MFSKNKSSISGSQSFTKSQTSMKKKKNPAPPRPPQPSPSRLLTSQSFGTVDELNTHSQSGYTASNRPHLFTNLIDFSAPDPPRPKSPVDLIASTQPDPPEFRYRVAASIFYIKSPLKNSTSGIPEANPFSPPRPSAQSLSTTVKSGNARQATSTSNTFSSTTVTSSTKYISNPTIIKSQTAADAQSYQHQTQQTHFSASSTAQDTQYSNVPLQWDEPPKRTPVVTVIKPLPPPKKPGLGTKTFQPTQPAIVRPVYAVVPEPRNYYDVPPDLDDDDDDEDDEDDFDFESKPMPDIPPPPPPSDLEIQEWGEENGTIAADKAYTDTYGMEADRAYAIALYDYTPEADGDLALQIGDLVYLTKKIDESWLFGVCGGIEGMFPTNYVNVVVPLPEQQEFQQVPQLTSHVEPTYAYAKVLYPFAAETESDLNLQTEEVVTILGRINDDWLYGEISGSKGQFPATFVDPVPLDLPIITL